MAGHEFRAPGELVVGDQLLTVAGSFFVRDVELHPSGFWIVACSATLHFDPEEVLKVLSPDGADGCISAATERHPDDQDGSPDMRYDDETCSADPDYFKCEHCDIWNHVDDRGTYDAQHADDCPDLRHCDDDQGVEVAF